MNLKSGYPFWSIRNGLMRPYPRLEQDTHCEVAIIGGGVTAALIAHELLRHGHEVVVIEQREIGWGSTSASTALLQYEIDTPMVDLAAQYGMPAAALAYGACAKAILDLQELCDGLGGCDFTRQDSLYYASRARDLKDLQRELDARKTHALPVEWIAGDALWHDYGVRSKAPFSAGSPPAWTPTACVTGCSQNASSTAAASTTAAPSPPSRRMTSMSICAPRTGSMCARGT